MTHAPKTPPRNTVLERLQTLTDEDVRQAATRLGATTENDDRVAVRVGDAAYDPQLVLALAAALEPDEIRFRDAQAVLTDLHFELIGANKQHDDEQYAARSARQKTHENDGPQAAPTEADQDASEGLQQVRIDFTPRLAQNMQRHQGQWVAVREGHLLAYDANLRDLLAKVGDTEVTVVFVPANPLGPAE